MTRKPVRLLPALAVTIAAAGPAAAQPPAVSPAIPFRGQPAPGPGLNLMRVNPAARPQNVQPFPPAGAPGETGSPVPTGGNLSTTPVPRPPEVPDRFTELRRALRHLEQSRAELVAVGERLGGSLDKVMEATDGATASILTVMDAWTAPVGDATERRQAAQPRSAMGHVQAAVKSLQAARRAVNDSRAGLGNYRDSATRDITNAEMQLMQVLAFNK